jgi:hypothetical protein
VDGPAAAQPARLASKQAGKAGNRSIPPYILLLDSEIRFLEYRLEVVESWPNSTRKQATIDGILNRLNSHSRRLPA